MSDKPPRPPTPLVTAFAMQIAVGLFMVLAPFGFDHPAPGQLDFNWLVIAAILYLFFLAGGLGLSAWHRHWRMAIAQIAGPFILGLLMLMKP